MTEQFLNLGDIVFVRKRSCGSGGAQDWTELDPTKPFLSQMTVNQGKTLIMTGQSTTFDN